MVGTLEREREGEGPANRIQDGFYISRKEQKNTSPRKVQANRDTRGPPAPPPNRPTTAGISMIHNVRFMHYGVYVCVCFSTICGVTIRDHAAGAAVGSRKICKGNKFK